MSIPARLLPVLLLSALANAPLQAAPFGWRGDGTGIFEKAVPPLIWSDGDNVMWKTRLPGWSNAAPVIAGDKIFVTAEPNQLVCLNRANGEILWTRALTYADTLPQEEADTLRANLKELEPVIARANNLRGKILRIQTRMKKDTSGSQQLNTLLKDAQKELEETEKELEDVRDYLPPPVPTADGYTSATPVTDGRHVYVVFGTGIAAKYDLEGNRLWARLLERPRLDSGYRASPALVGGKLVVAINRNIRGLDPETGESKWRARAPEAPGSVVPVIHDNKKVVASPTGYLIDTLTGSRYTDKLGALPLNAPLYSGGALFFISNKSAVYVPPKEWSEEAFKDLKPVWEAELPEGRYIASPLRAGDYVYAVTYDGKLSILNKQGKVTDSKQLDLQAGTGFYASPILAGGMVFLTSDDGRTRLIKPGATYDEVGINTLEPLRSAPIAIGDRLYFRGQRFLYCLGVK